MSMSGKLLARPKAREAEIRATIIRADGSIVELGTVSYWHRNPLRRWLWTFCRYLREKV